MSNKEADQDESEDYPNKPFIPENPNRGAGILNENRRKYYLPKYDVGIEPKTSGDRDKRAEIRLRIDNSMLDFPILAEYMRDGDFKQLLKGPQTNSEKRVSNRLDLEKGTGFRFEQLVLTPDDKIHFRNIILEKTIIEMVRFMFRLVENNEIPVKIFIEKVIPEAYRRYAPDESMSVDVSIESKESVESRAKEKYEQGLEMTTEEKAVLFESMSGEMSINNPPTKCPECSNKNPSDANFCGFCGNELVSEEK